MGFESKAFSQFRTDDEHRGRTATLASGIIADYAARIENLERDGKYDLARALVRERDDKIKAAERQQTIDFTAAGRADRRRAREATATPKM